MCQLRQTKWDFKTDWETSKQRFLSHSHDISSTEQSQLRARFHGKPKVIDPSLHTEPYWALAEEEKKWRATRWLLKLCLEMTHLFASAHILFSRENQSHGSAWVQGDGDKDTSSCIRWGINVGERSCSQLLVFLPYSAFSHTRPLSSQKEVDSPFSEPLEAKCISGSEFFICYGITKLMSIELVVPSNHTLNRILAATCINTSAAKHINIHIKWDK